LCVITLDDQGDPDAASIACLEAHGISKPKGLLKPPKPETVPPGTIPRPTKAPQPKPVLPLVYSMQNTPLADTLIGSIAIPYPATIVQIAASAGDAGSSAAGTPACEFLLTATTFQATDVAGAATGETVIPLNAPGGAISLDSIHVPFGTDLELFTRYPLPLYPGYLNLIGRTCVIAGAPAALHVSVLLEDTGAADLRAQFTPAPDAYDYYARIIGRPSPPSRTSTRTTTAAAPTSSANMIALERIAQQLRNAPFGLPGGFVESAVRGAGFTDVAAASQIVRQLAVKAPNLALLASAIK
jgi:hypothetical protein